MNAPTQMHIRWGTIMPAGVWPDALPAVSGVAQTALPVVVLRLGLTYCMVYAADARLLARALHGACAAGVKASGLRLDPAPEPPGDVEAVLLQFAVAAYRQPDAPPAVSLTLGLRENAGRDAGNPLLGFTLLPEVALMLVERLVAASREAESMAHTLNQAPAHRAV